MDERIGKIKQLAIMGLFSEDELLQRLVLKGGNALALVHNRSVRSSKDINVSMEADLAKDERERFGSLIQAALARVYSEAGFTVVDYRFETVPSFEGEPGMEFWGGYQVRFKVLETADYEKVVNDVIGQRKKAVPLVDSGSTIFRIDISRHEYCRSKEPVNFQGYTVYVYTPEMLLFEKLRAICQQMPEYRASVKSQSLTPRAKDFGSSAESVGHDGLR